LTYVYPLFYSMQVNDVLRDLNLGIQPILRDSGVEIVEITLKKADGTFSLSLLVDKPTGVTVGECIRLNKRISRCIEEKELMAGKYSLEVSSPGIDRPLKKPSDFRRLQDKIVDIWLFESVDGQNLIRGTIECADKDGVNILDTNNSRHTISYVLIDKAMLHI